jgi:rod shape determining protein RodA
MMGEKIREFDLLDARINVFNIRNLRHVDWVLAGLVLSLAVAGFIVLHTASPTHWSPSSYDVRQCAYFVVGLGLALAILCIDSRFLISLAPVLYVGAVGILVLVIVVGDKAKGGQRWLLLGPLHLQPSEETKVILIYTLVWYLTLIKERVRKLPYFLGALVIAGIPAALIFKQPNLGTALTLFPVAFVMLFVAGCKKWHLAAIVIAGICISPYAYGHLKEYQKNRLTSFINPEDDPLVTGLQVLQSKITVGSGGMTGKGFGNGTQTALNYLPEYHTDFIFSHMAEEYGFVGCAIVIALFAVFLWRGLQLAAECQDMSGTLLAAGVVAILAFHVFVNIAITVGLMPVTGIPLPFLSYGGNFYLTTMMCVGVLWNVPVRKHLFD